MMSSSDPPIVSVVITCYNHGHFLSEAIESVLTQTWSPIEIIVVDDGSLDNTRVVADQYSTVSYKYQINQGLSAARNTGANYSRGDYLVFLDADDWLCEQAIEIGIAYLQQNPIAVFTSGAYINVDLNNKVLTTEGVVVEDNHYLRLLESNYIGMHATVMYRRHVFDTYTFDTSLSACEDYDLYLRIARHHPIIHHTVVVAAYRRHTSNMSKNFCLMFASVEIVLSRQKALFQTAEERQAYRKGKRFWEDFYVVQAHNELYNGTHNRSDLTYGETLRFIRKYKPSLYIRYQIRKVLPIIALKKIVMKYIPNFAARLLFKIGVFSTFKPAIGKVRLGDLNRISPFSSSFGYDRGGPVDRYYIENFLQQESTSIRGRVLEIGDNSYTIRFGGNRVTHSDVLHVDSRNVQATIVGDLSHAPHIPDNNFDCIILTQTLHLIYNINSALETCERILKPGGVLLLSVPGISQIDRDEWSDNWLWSFTATSLRKLLSAVFPAKNAFITTHGNVFIATAFLFGMGVSEVTKEQLDFMDPQYQVIITAKAIKPKPFD